MKRFLFIIIPKRQNDSPLQFSGSTFLHQLTQIRDKDDPAVSQTNQNGSRLDWKRLRNSISKVFDNIQIQEKALHVVGSSNSLLFLLEQLKSSELLSQLTDVEKHLLHFHPVIRDQDAAKIHLNRLFRHIVSLPGCMLSTIIDGDQAMDTSNRWERTETYYRMLIHGEGELFTNRHMTNLEQKAEDGNPSVRVPAVHHSFAGIQQGDSLIIIPDKPGEFEQIYRSFHRERFAPFERSAIELNSLEQFVPSTDSAQAILNRLASHLGERNLPYLKCGSMDDYFFLTQVTEEAALPDSSEDRVFLPANAQSSSGIQDYFNTLSNHVESDRYHGIFTSLPWKFAESDTSEIFESMNQALKDLTHLAKEHGYVSLFCIPVDHKTLLVFLREGESNQRIPGITMEELFTNVLDRLN